MAPPRNKRKASLEASSKKAKKAPPEKKASLLLANKHVATNTTSTTTIDIASLYKSYKDNNDDGDRLTHSVTSLQVWETLGGLLNDETHHTNNNNYLWKQGCELFVVLVTEESRNTLEFVDNALVFTKLFETIVQQHPFQTSKGNDNSSDFWKTLATTTHFVNVTWSAGQTNVCLQSECLQKHVGSSLTLWKWMLERRRELELKQRGLEMEYEKQQQQTLDEKKKTSPPDTADDHHEPFVVTVVHQLFHLLHGSHLKLGNHHNNTKNKASDEHSDLLLKQWIFVHRALEFLVDILSITGSQRFVAIYLQSLHFVLQCRLVLGVSKFSKADENLFLAQQLLDRIDNLLKQYPVVFGDEDCHYKSLSTTEQLALYHARATILQKLCHRYYASLVPDLIFAGVGLLCKSPIFLRNSLGGLQDNQLLELLHKMRLIDSTRAQMELYNREFLLAVMEDFIIMPPNPVQQLSSFPLYPTQDVLWDWTKIPPSLSSLLPASRVLALPKLASGRFLSFLDYLSRNFELMRLETAYEIRTDLVDAIKRLRPVIRQKMTEDEDDNQITKLTTEFTGWARMALELGDVDGGNSFKIVKVSKPLLGQPHPEQVIAEVTVDLKSCGDSIRREWDELGEFDNVFLVSIDASKMSGDPAPLLSEYHLHHGNHRRWDNDKDRRVPDEDDSTFPDRFGVVLVRGCMIQQVRDEKGNIISDPGAGAPVGTKRTYRVALDPSQFTQDKKSSAGTDIYNTFNLIVRRRGAENNFKAVLETIRGLMVGMGSIDRVIPSWLQSVLLGHGEPDLAHFKSAMMREYAMKTVGVAKPDSLLDFGDTFISEAHLRDSFGGQEIIIDDNKGLKSNEGARKDYRIRFVEGQDKTILHVESYPFPAGFAGNPVPFTPVQVNAIRSGLSPGLTMVVGPPGTGSE